MKKIVLKITDDLNASNLDEFLKARKAVREAIRWIKSRQKESNHGGLRAEFDNIIRALHNYELEFQGKVESIVTKQFFKTYGDSQD